MTADQTAALNAAQQAFETADAACQAAQAADTTAQALVATDTANQVNVTGPAAATLAAKTSAYQAFIALANAGNE